MPTDKILIRLHTGALAVIDIAGIPDEIAIGFEAANNRLGIEAEGHDCIDCKSKILNEGPLVALRQIRPRAVHRYGPAGTCFEEKAGQGVIDADGRYQLSSSGGFAKAHEVRLAPHHR